MISPDARLGFMVPISDLGGVISTGVLLPPLDIFPDILNSPNLKSGEVYVWVGGGGRVAAGSERCWVKGVGGSSMSGVMAGKAKWSG